MSVLRRPEQAPLRLYTQRIKAWEKGNARTAALLHYVVAMAFTGLFAYRLLLLSQHWAKRPFSRHFAASSSSLAAGFSANPWLPAPWVGQPPALDPLACTPQLLIIGAMKGGTTALFHYLNGSQPAIHYPNGSKSHVDFKPRCAVGGNSKRAAAAAAAACTGVGSGTRYYSAGSMSPPYVHCCRLFYSL
jgi:hypothetical protein